MYYLSFTEYHTTSQVKFSTIIDLNINLILDISKGVNTLEHIMNVN